MGSYDRVCCYDGFRYSIRIRHRSINGEAFMEKWDLYKKDENDNIIKTDIEWIRGEKIPVGYYHLVVHVWIKNSKGEFLMSKRSSDRPRYPLLWECPGGSVLKGEESLEGALREVFEEVGVKLNKNFGKVIHSNIRDDKSDVMDVWEFIYDGDADLEHAPTKEVCEVKWMTYNEIVNLYKDNQLVPTLGYIFNLYKPNIHNMNLNPSPFYFINNELKDIEMRLNDEKRSIIKIGDMIKFTNNETKEEVNTLVVDLHKYDDFSGLYNKFDKTRLGYLENEIAKTEDMEEYYSKENIRKYGVLGIEVRKLNF